jgi:hypothetical protein
VQKSCSGALHRLDGDDSLAAFAGFDQGQAALIILINRYAIETLKTLAVVNFSSRRNRLIFAAMATGLAWRSACISSRNPRPTL